MATEFTMPYGYTGKVWLTEAELKLKATFKNCHPELQRRFLACAKYLWAIGVPLGVGTGWRVQPADNRPGFAKPGNSWHEGVPVESGQNALAIDTVPAESWNAMEPILARFGLRSFRTVNKEPWHVQLIEIPASRSYATTLPPIKHWDLGDVIKPPAPRPAGDDDMAQRTLVKDTLNNAPFGTWYVAGEVSKAWIPDGDMLEQHAYRVAEAMGLAVDYNKPAPPIPSNVELTEFVSFDGFRYRVISNGNPDFIASLGPIVGPIPPGLDQYGKKK